MKLKGMAPKAHKVLYSPLEHQKEDLSPRETLLATHRSTQDNSTGYAVFARPQIIPVFPSHRRFHQLNQVIAMSVDLEKAIALDSNSTFEAIAMTPGNGGISVYRPERFVLNHEHHASALSVNALVAMLFFGSGSSPRPGRLRGRPRPYDGLGRSPFATWFPGESAPESTTGTSPGRVRASSSANGSRWDPFRWPPSPRRPYGLPSPGRFSAKSTFARTFGPARQELPSNEASSRKRTLGD